MATETSKIFMVIMTILLIVAGFAFGYGIGYTVHQKTTINMAVEICDDLPNCEWVETLGGIQFITGYTETTIFDGDGAIIEVNLSVE